MARKSTRKRQDSPVEHGPDQKKATCGNPPEEYRWKPGQSGNPKGQPRHRTNLWTWYCKYMAMTDAETGKLDRTKLTGAQQTALRLVEKAKTGKGCGAERMARYVVDREEGRAVEHLVIAGENDLTDAECEELRSLMRKRHGRDTDQ